MEPSTYNRNRSYIRTEHCRRSFICLDWVKGGANTSISK